MSRMTLLRAFELVASTGFAANVLALDLRTMFGSSSDKNATQTAQNMAAQQGNLIQRYLEAQIEAVTAQRRISEAFDLHDQAGMMDAEIQALSSGSLSKDELERTTEVTRSAQKVLEEKIASGEQLTDEGRKEYQEGPLPYQIGSFLVESTVSSVPSAFAEISSDTF